MRRPLLRGGERKEGAKEEDEESELKGLLC